MLFAKISAFASTDFDYSLFARKRAESVHFRIAYCKLNAVIERNVYRVQRMHECVDFLRDANASSTVIASKVYCQAKINEIKI